MDVPTRIAQVLTPHLGPSTADAVARHLCAKHGVSDAPVEPGVLAALQETIRRGLVAFVGAERAVELSRLCFPPEP